MGTHWRGGRELKYFDVNGEVKEDPEVLFYGWECEICSCSQLYSSQLHDASEAFETLIPGYDGSVNPYGAEIKTQPMTFSRFYNDPGVNFLFAAAAGDSVPRRHFTNESCGGHIHVSLDPISPDQLERIARFVFGHPAFSEWISGRESRAFRTWSWTSYPNSIYGGPAPVNALCDFARLTHKKKDKSQYPQYHSNCAIAVNRDTLEFRLFRGSVVPQEVYKNLEFIDLLVRVADIGVEITPGTFRDAAMDMSDDYRNLALFLSIPTSPATPVNSFKTDIPAGVVAHYYAKYKELGVSF